MGDFIFLVWEAVERLERLGFKVLVITGDGASANRKFFRISGTCRKVVIRQKIHTQTTNVTYFVSEHLMKTVRNCWSHSYGHGNTRKLWVSTLLLIPVCVFCVHT